MDQQTISEESVEAFIFSEKEVSTQHYELLLLAAHVDTEEQAQAAFDAVKQEVTTLGGTITLEQPLGYKPLAYTIRHSKNGWYFVLEFDLLTIQLAVLNEKLRIRKDVTRCLIVKKRVKSPEELAEEERVRQKIESRRRAKKNQEAAATHKEEIVREREQGEQRTARASSTTITEPTSTKPSTTPTSETSEKPAPRDIDKGLEKLLSDDLDV